jgi:DNA-binding transcriptional regulator YiaG
VTMLDSRWPAESTSASGAMLVRRLPSLRVIGTLLAGSGTSSERVPTDARLQLGVEVVEHTNAGLSLAGAHDPEISIAELRRSSGLTWDQLARLFRVSRRSLHFWASGKAMTPSNEEHLQRLLAVIRKMDRGSSDANRAVLVATSEDGTIPFDLLVDEQYERASALLGTGGAPRASMPRFSPQAMASRAPRPPEERVGALQDRVHPASGRLLAAKPVRVPRRT